MEVCGISDSVEFAALCLFLAPISSLAIDIEAGEEFIYRYFRGDAHPFPLSLWEEDPPRHGLRSLCHSDTLTTLHYQGYCFPTGLLQYVPNLRDLSISREEEHWGRIRSDGPYLQGLPLDEMRPPLSFRLRRAHFSNVDEIFAGLVTLAP